MAKLRNLRRSALNSRYMCAQHRFPSHMERVYQHRASSATAPTATRKTESRCEYGASMLKTKGVTVVSCRVVSCQVGQKNVCPIMLYNNHRIQQASPCLPDSKSRQQPVRATRKGSPCWYIALAGVRTYLGVGSCVAQLGGKQARRYHAPQPAQPVHNARVHHVINLTVAKTAETSQPERTDHLVFIPSLPT